MRSRINMVEITNLNDIRGFSWATKPRTDEPFAKVSLCSEAFWIRDCVPCGANTYLGVVDNEVSGEHGLELGDLVTFTPTER
jgi:hypothetical protein